MKTLTELNEYTTPINVPEGTDTRAHAADDVEHIAQVLANRTTYLKNISDNVAVKNAENVFTKAQYIDVGAGNEDYPLITTHDKPGDNPGNPANRWKLIMALPTVGTTWTGLFIGQTPDGAALVNNARWHLPTQKWRRLDASLPAMALVGRAGQYTMSLVPVTVGDPPVPGPTEWTDWPLDFGGDLLAGGNVSAHYGFVYTPEKSRSDPINLGTIRGPAHFFDGADGVGFNEDDAFGSMLCIPIAVPPGGKLGMIEFIVRCNDAAQRWQMTLWRRTVTNFTGPNPPTPPLPTSLASATTPAAAGNHLLQLAVFGPDIDIAEGAEYFVYATRLNSGVYSGNDRILGGRMITWRDPGPRNKPWG